MNLRGWVSKSGSRDGHDAQATRLLSSREGFGLQSSGDDQATIVARGDPVPKDFASGRAKIPSVT